MNDPSRREGEARMTNIYRFGNETIVTEQIRAVGLAAAHVGLDYVPLTPSWRAYYDGDRKRWEAGHSEAEVLGKIVLSYGSESTEWCPVCHTYHVDPGEKTDAGQLTRQCPQIPGNDPRNVFANYPCRECEAIGSESHSPECRSYWGRR